MKESIHIACLFAFLLCQLFSQKISGQTAVHTYTEGRIELFSESTRILFQDQKGFIWGINKRGILSVFDGYEFKHFSVDPNDTLGMSNYLVTPLFEDSRGKVWIPVLGGIIDRYDPVRERFENFQKTLETVAGLSPRFVNDVMEDQSGDIWLATQIGLYKYSYAEERFRFFPGEWAWHVFQDSPGNIYFCSPKGVGELDQKTGKTDLFIASEEMEEDASDGSNFYGYELGEVDQFLLLTGQSKSYLLDTKKRRIGFLQLDFEEGEFLTCITEKNGVLIGGTSTGSLFQFELEDYGFSISRPINTLEKIKGSIIDLFIDDQGIIWVSEWIEGQVKTWKVFPDQRIAFLPSENLVGRAFNYKGEIFLLSGDGIMPLSRRSPNTSSRATSLQKPENTLYMMAPVVDRKGHIWIGTGMIGSPVNTAKKALIYEYSPAGEILSAYSYTTADSLSFLNTAFIDMDIDQNGVLWIANWWSGLISFDPERKVFQQYLPEPENENSLSENSTTAILVDRENNIWIGYGAAGLSRYDQRTGQFSHYRHMPGDLTSLSNNRVLYLDQDSEGQIWVGTQVGLNRYDAANNAFIRYLEEDGLANNTIHGIREDQSGGIWITTNSSSLSKYEPKQDRIVRFATSIDFGPDSRNTAIDAEGNIYIKAIRSGQLGFAVFNPDSLRIPDYPPRLVLTALLVSNNTVIPGAKDSILSKSIQFSDRVELNFRQRNFTLKYSALEYFEPEGIRFSYKLEGYDQTWQEVGQSREATYTNLDPGTYTFQLSTVNNLGIKSENGANLAITILPPWWLTWWAYVIYGLIILSILYAVYRFLLNRRLAQAETIRLRELDQVKTKLYTNITHEFRTPLTVIQGVTDQIESSAITKRDKVLETNARIVKRNSAQLLSLVNQMLDLRKLESGNLPVNLIQGDIVIYLKYLLESFHSLAESKDIRLHFLSKDKEVIMDYDPEKIRHIVANLLSNAVKFTPEGGDVYVSVGSQQSAVGSRQSAVGSQAMDKEVILISVKDTGIGIPTDKLPHIFDRFYQVDDESTRKAEGTGIGLTLTRELAKLLEGEISVESEPGSGTTFEVMLPIHHTAPLIEGAPAVSDPKVAMAVAGPVANQQTAPGSVVTSELPLALIVEDNRDVANYIRSCLEGFYRVELAENGQKGIDKAIESVPDLIISDVMMPEKDGFEVTQTLKSDPHTSHIPIILLTARADIQSKLQGLERGADAYLPKPFNQEELLIRSRKLLELRQKLQAHYLVMAGSAASTPTPAESPEEQQEDAFVLRVREAVEHHLTDFDFSVEQLAGEVHMSRSQLHRKLSALTGYSATHFIRYIRLNKAKELLQDPELAIGNVAYDSGFSDPVYFTRVFKQEFGWTPTDYREGNRKDSSD